MTRPARLILVLALVLSGCAGRKKPMPAIPRPIGWTETGVASWYGPPYHGRRAANGEIYDMEKMTAAHRTLPFDTWVRVRNLSNGRITEVRITDRGPFVKGRIIDLSKASAREIDLVRAGIAKVQLQVIHPPKQIEVAAIAPATPVEPPLAPTPPVPPPLAPPVPVRSLELFAVQVGAFTDRAGADRVRADMEQRYGSARLVERQGSRVQWRVLVGAMETLEGAEALAARIRLDGGAGFVVRIDEPVVAPQP